MKKIGLVLTILIFISGCSAARPVIRTEETTAKSKTSAYSGNLAGQSTVGAKSAAQPDGANSTGRIEVSTNADESKVQSTKADPIKNAADKTVGSQNSLTGAGTQPATTKPAGTKSPDTKAPLTMAPPTKPEDPAVNTPGVGQALSPKKQSAYNLFDYYPLIANRRVDLNGPSGDSSLILQYLYEESGMSTAQLKQFTTAGSQLNVISINQNQVTELYYSQDIDYRENIIGLKDYVQRVILKAPLTVGHQWDSTGLHFEIIAVDEPRVINGQKLTVMDVTIATGSEKILFTYAVGVGLVSNDVIKPDGSLTNIVHLVRIKEDARDSYTIDFFFPAKTGGTTLVPQNVEFNTNDATKDKLTEVYKDIAAKQGYEAVMGAKTQIQFIFSQDNIVHVDLNQAFIDFINQTPQLEEQRLNCLVDTLCKLYSADGMILTINDQRYESLNRKIEPTEILTPLFNVSAP